jgi:RimJ/RimL family protein N-acetyltransferase
MPLRVIGPRLTFERFSEDAITPDYLAWLNDRDLMQYSRQRFSTHTRESALAFARSFDEGNGYFWSIRRSDDGERIGTLTMYVDATNGVGDFGILIGRNGDRGSGFGREASGMAIAFLFDVRGLRRVTAGTLAPNVAMIRCCAHWGMTLEGVLRQHGSAGLDPVRFVDDHCYGILRDEWNALPHRLSVAVEGTAR